MHDKLQALDISKQQKNVLIVIFVLSLLLFTFQNCTELKSLSQNSEKNITTDLTPQINFPGWQTPYVGYFASATAGVGNGNYIGELSNISNVIFIEGSDPDIQTKMSQAVAANLKLIISGRYYFFDSNGDIYPNFQDRWGLLKARIENQRSNILAIYLHDEPFWLFMSTHAPADLHYDWLRDWLNAASLAVKSDWPEMKTAFIEGYPAIRDNTFMNPDKVDWIGMDGYDDFDNCSGLSIPQYYNRIKNTMFPHQKLILVPPTGQSVNFRKTEEEILAEITKYDNFAKTDSRFILTTPFLWQTFQDTSGPWLGARDLPLVKAELLKRHRP